MGDEQKKKKRKIETKVAPPPAVGGGLFDDLPDTIVGPAPPPVVEKDDTDCLFAVLDGHGGNCAAKLCAQELPSEVQKCLEASGRDTEEARRSAFEEVFQALDRHCRITLGPSICAMCGTTCVFGFAWLEEDAPGKFGLLLANLGDSRALVLRESGEASAKPLVDKDGKAMRLKLAFETVDHKPENPSETFRIEQAGGEVGIHPDDTASKPRVDKQLGCSRALGDFSYKENPALIPEKQKVSNKPDIYELSCQFGDAVVLACDGVFDVLSSEAAALIVAKKLQETDDPRAAAQALV